MNEPTRPGADMSLMSQWSPPGHSPSHVSGVHSTLVPARHRWESVTTANVYNQLRAESRREKTWGTELSTHKHYEQIIRVTFYTLNIKRKRHGTSTVSSDFYQLYDCSMHSEWCKKVNSYGHRILHQGRLFSSQIFLICSSCVIIEYFTWH